MFQNSRGIFRHLPARSSRSRTGNFKHYRRAAVSNSYDRTHAFKPTLPNAPFMMLEHVNINIACMDKAKTFYIDTLLAGEDTRTDEIVKIVPGATGLLWANLGLQQLHLPVDKVQRFRGEIVVDYPNKESLKNVGACLHAAESKLGDTQFSWRWGTAGRLLKVTCPWGNTFTLSAQSELGDVKPGWYSPEGTLPAGTTTGHPCLNTPVALGIRALRYFVPKGTAQGIGRFYRHYFDTGVVITDVAEGLQSCIIRMGTHQTLQFLERDEELPDYDGHHICVYISSFDECYSRFKDEGMIYENPRFPNLTYESLERAQELNEFRIIDIVDPECPEKVLCSLEHEIRHPLHHGFPLKEHLAPRF